MIASTAIDSFGIFPPTFTFQVKISIGHEFYVTTDDKYAEQGSSDYLYIDYKNLPKKVEVGRNIFIDDGKNSKKSQGRFDSSLF